ncbi:MAG TPA: ribonuclease III [Mycobacteriales bacterium]|nr:ribonuclease III [Mycobacteriales bacterium]
MSGPTAPAGHPEPGRFAELEVALGTPLDPDLIEQALTHRSFAYENGGLPTNERLEFLGDAVLGLVVTEALYAAHPDLPEGQLAKLRAGVVSSRALADVARGVGLGDWVRLGRGEQTTGGRDKSSILADTLEALLGAVYLDRGLPAAVLVVRRLCGPLLDSVAAADGGRDWKTTLQERSAAEGLGVPQYRIDDTGPAHAKHFTAHAVVAGRELGTGTGRTKKEAEQVAAEQAWRALSRA